MQEFTARDAQIEGRKALRQRDFTRAGIAFCRGADIEPENPIHSRGAAIAARRLGDYGTAENHYRAAIDAAERLTDRDGAGLAAMATSLVDLYRRLGRYRDAENLCVRVLDSARAGQSRVTRSRIQVCLSELYQQQKRYDAAERTLRAAVASRREIFGDLHPKTTNLLPRLDRLCSLLAKRAAGGSSAQKMLATA